MGGVYSNQEIFQAIKDGVIVCAPFDADHVAEASLDVTLGHYFYHLEPQGDNLVYNPFDKRDVDRFFGKPLTAVPHRQYCKDTGMLPFKNIPDDHPVIVIRPGERILAHTHEFVGIRACGGACSLHSRSSWGRNGVAVCFDAGWVDPGYINRLTLEVCNLNQHESVVLPVGERIAQIVFYHTGTVDGSYECGRNGFSGKYQADTELDKLIKNWRPEQMLPKAYLDKRISPAPVKGLLDNLK